MFCAADAIGDCPTDGASAFLELMAVPGTLPPTRFPGLPRLLVEFGPATGSRDPTGLQVREVAVRNGRGLVPAALVRKAFDKRPPFLLGDHDHLAFWLRSPQV